MWDLQEQTTEALIDQYAAAAREHGTCTERGDHLHGNEVVENIATTYRELKRRGQKDQFALLPLLKNDDPWVRCWAASHALEFAPAEAEPVLQEINAQFDGPLGLDAEMILEEWKKGTLKFP